MGLVVDEIVDIVEDRLNIEVGSGTPGVLGAAIVHGHATEILDVAHFLPLAYEDWFLRKDTNAGGGKRKLLLVDDSAFFRNLLVPVLNTAGFEVTTAGDGREALALLDKKGRFDVVVSDIEMPDMDGLQLAEALGADARMAGAAFIALTSHISADMIERLRGAGFRAFVAKFDRQGLIAALKEAPSEISRAA
jgi:two-component system chemotaxis sensor kinase CheA